jgi:hypothetical protein
MDFGEDREAMKTEHLENAYQTSDAKIHATLSAAAQAAARTGAL